MFFDYVRERSGVSFCFQTIKHELGFRKRVVSTVEHRRGGKYPFRGHPNLDAWKINFLLQFSAQLNSPVTKNFPFSYFAFTFIHCSQVIKDIKNCHSGVKHFLPVHCHCDAWLLKWRTYQNWPLTLLRLIKLNKIPVKMIYFNYIRNNIRFYENVYLKDLIMLT